MRVASVGPSDVCLHQLHLAHGSHKCSAVVADSATTARRLSAMSGLHCMHFRFTGEEVVFAVTMDRNHDLVQPHTCCMVYGPGHQHFGAYGLGSDCSWFTSTARKEAAPETWGPVTDPKAIDDIKQELAVRYKGWKLVESMLDREVAVMIRVSLGVVLYCSSTGPHAGWLRHPLTTRSWHVLLVCMGSQYQDMKSH